MFSVVVPLIGTARAAQRLGGDAALARAIALDTLTAVLSAHEVSRLVVVVDTPELVDDVSQAVHDAGSDVPAAVLLDRSPEADPLPSGEDPTLNEAVRGTVGQLSGRIAILHGALPTLTGEALDNALAAAATADFAFAQSTNSAATAMLTASDPALLVTSFGQHSAQRHLALGARQIDANPEVTLLGDTTGQVANLLDAATLGARTRAATSSWRVTPRDRTGEPERRQLPDPQPPTT